MLYRLSIENFGSILDEQVLDLTISAKVPFDEDRHLIGPDGIRVPKVAAIFGANASGKTTVLRAHRFLSEFLISSAHDNPKKSLKFLPFANEASWPKQSAISVEIFADFFGDGATRFRYRLETENSAGPNSISVKCETLAFMPRTRWIKLADRNKTVCRLTNRLKHLESTIPPSALERRNTSIFSLLRQFAPEDFFVVNFSAQMATFDNFVYTKKDFLDEEDVIARFEENPDALNDMIKDIRSADLGIEDIQIVERDDNKRLMFQHSGLSARLLLNLESQGTSNFVRLFPILHAELKYGGIALMDELDSDLHPNLLREIIGWFRSPDRNRSGAQMLMSCNNTAVMDWLEKEEIFFTEKDEQGRTHIRALKDMPGVRRDANFQREYLSGRYGAVPNIG